MLMDQEKPFIRHWVVQMNCVLRLYSKQSSYHFTQTFQILSHYLESATNILDHKFSLICMFLFGNWDFVNHFMKQKWLKQEMYATLIELAVDFFILKLIVKGFPTKEHFRFNVKRLNKHKGALGKWVQYKVKYTKSDITMFVR